MSDGNDVLNLPGVGEIHGTKLDVETSAENSAKLSDGTTVRFKAVLTEVFRENGFDESGDPKYYFKFGLVVYGIEIPVNLKKGAASESK